MRNPYHTIVREHYAFWNAYNDKHKDGSRRLAYCTNGCDMDIEELAYIQSCVEDDMGMADLPGVVEWIQSYRHGYGTYWKLTIQVPVVPVV